MVGIALVGEVVDAGKELQPGLSQVDPGGAQRQVKTGIAVGGLFPRSDLLLAGGIHHRKFRRSDVWKGVTHSQPSVERGNPRQVVSDPRSFPRTYDPEATTTTLGHTLYCIPKSAP